MTKPTHQLLNYYGCRNLEILAKIDPLCRVVNNSMVHNGSINGNSYYHQFQPEGVTFIYLDEVTQIAGHTWPERRAMTLDVVSHNSENGVNFVRSLSQGINPLCVFPPNQSGVYERQSKKDLGTHVTGYFEGVTEKWVDTPHLRLKKMKEIAVESGFTMVGEVAYEGTTSSSTGLVLAESHFIVRRGIQNQLWVDIFTCGQEGSSLVGMDHLQGRISADYTDIKCYNR